MAAIKTEIRLLLAAARRGDFRALLAAADWWQENGKPTQERAWAKLLDYARGAIRRADAAYDAIRDHYLEVGNERAAEGVRRAQSHRRRPFKPYPLVNTWNWCDHTLHKDLVYRSAVCGGDAYETFDTATAAWEWLGDHEGPLV